MVVVSLFVLGWDDSAHGWRMRAHSQIASNSTEAGQLNRTIPAVIEQIAQLGGQGSDAVLVHGVHIFVGIPFEVVILDATEILPSREAIRSRIALPQMPRALYVRDDTLYALMPTFGIAVINVEIISEPRLINTILTPPNATAFHIKDNIAYVVDEDAALTVISLSEPSQGLVLGTVQSNLASSLAIDLLGDVALMAGVGGIETVNIHDPTNPFVMGRLALDTTVEDVVISGERAVIAASYLGVRFIDIHNATSPMEESLSEELVGTIGGVEWVGDMVYAADQMSGKILVIEAIAGRTPTLIREVQLSSLRGPIDVEGDIMTVATYLLGPHVLNVSVPTEPKIVREQLALRIDSWEATGVVLSHNRLVALTNENVNVYDVSSENNPALLGVIERVSIAPGQHADQDRGFVYALSGKLHIFDLNVTPPIEATSITARDSDTLHRLVAFPQGIVGASNDSIVMLDTSEPYNPRTIARSSKISESSINCLASLGSLVYVCTTVVPRGEPLRHQLRILVAQGPGELGQIGGLDLPSDSAARPGHAMIVDERLFVIAETSMYIVDISDKSSPTLSASISLPSNQARFSVNGNYMFLYGGSDMRVDVLDIQDRDNPDLVNSWQFPDIVHDLEWHNEYLIIANGRHGITVWRTTLPARSLLYLPMAMKRR